MPTGEDYRFLYVMLYNMGRGYHVKQESDGPPTPPFTPLDVPLPPSPEPKTLQQIMIDDEYEIIYEPVGERDIVVGRKGDEVIGIADLWGPWAINLNEKVEGFPPTTTIEEN
tara:strand:+ start:111 stop:446 length:336 start_codon:yes stop_codon:yes gene_type:complete